jgi:hypothetical protein
MKGVGLSAVVGKVIAKVALRIRVSTSTRRMVTIPFINPLKDISP